VKYRKPPISTNAHTYFRCRLPAHPQATMPEGLLAQTGLVDGGAIGGANSVYSAYSVVKMSSVFGLQSSVCISPKSTVYSLRSSVSAISPLPNQAPRTKYQEHFPHFKCVVNSVKNECITYEYPL
jgi:hypothetical protein